jgi:hypothetical protein
MRILLFAATLVLASLFALSACTAPAQRGASRPLETAFPPPLASDLPAAKPVALSDQGLAPELHNDVWLNSDPIKLADLRGNVVIVEFWTYG